LKFNNFFIFTKLLLINIFFFNNYFLPKIFILISFVFVFVFVFSNEILFMDLSLVFKLSILAISILVFSIFFSLYFVLISLSIISEDEILFNI
jgi:hypothetical protein